MGSVGIEILAYGELKQKNALLPLMEQAFGWPFDPTEFEKSIRMDPRLRSGSVGFCALKEGKVVGYAGVMDFTLRTVSGTEEKVGGLYGVATYPGYTRQGICTALLNRSHEYFMAKGYRFSLLTTSPTIVAHILYRKLGYFDVAPFLSAYLEARKKKVGVSKRGSVSRLDYSRMLEFFREYVRGRTGFVIRDKEYLRMLFKQYGISAKDCMMTEKGYVIFKKEKESVRIRELVAQDSSEMNRLIGLVENKTQKVVVGRLGIADRAVSLVYASRGFTVLEAGHAVLMVKELVAGASFNDCFGSGFYMSALDHF
jgi:ribosomal protein S18 acetylase RimI-like enzyme